MFRRVFCMDLKRSFSPVRFLTAVGVVTFLLMLTVWDNVEAMLPYIHEDYETLRWISSAVDYLQRSMTFDVFKVVAVFFLASLYTSSYCKDENSRYLRFICSRTDLYTYVRSRFLANLTVILVTSVLACLLVVGVFVSMGFPLVSVDGQGGSLNPVYFSSFAGEHPLLYAGMLGVEFGLISAACCSLGLLLSAYQPNAFVCIGGSGFLFFILISSEVLNSTPFDIGNMIGLTYCMIGPAETTPPALLLAWVWLFPFLIVSICCQLFERRMRWRAKNGTL